jgi:uncharacterized protein YegL
MPRLNSSLENHQTGTFGFSATSLTDLEDSGASEYTLVTLIYDVSGSTSPFQKEMESSLKEIVSACMKSPRADNLMIRIIKFENKVHEIHGFKLLSQINTADYDGALAPGGLTALYDACVNGIEALNNYGNLLLKQDFSVNGIVFVITDGESNFGTLSDPKFVKDELKRAVSGENLESLISILIAVNAGECSQALQKFNSEAEFTSYIELNDASSSTLAKLAKFASKSVSSQSKALGTGGPSQNIVW